MKKKISLVFLMFMMFMIKFNNVLAYSNFKSKSVSCGEGLIKGIPANLPRVINIFYLGLQIVVPILLVIFGMIDLIKAITAGKEDEIKRAQGTFLRRIIVGVLVFFIFAIVKLLVNIGADDSTQANKIVKCMDCFLNNSCGG